MFYSTYDKVSMYCGGCAKHKYPEMMEEGKFPLLLSVKGPKKTISAELNKLCQGENEVLVIEEEDDYSLMNKENEKLLHDEKYQIAKNVPYRLLSAFMRELGGNDPLWSQRTRLIAYMEKISNRCCMPYIIGTERGLEKRIILEGSWKRFLIDNMVYIRGWIQMKKIKYLQDRNPGVPGIIYKLEPENEKHRKLQKIRGLWTAVIEMSDIYDIYSGSHIEQNEYEIDHFVPWSFVTNDEMWNLIPVNPSLNASKRDKLPNWDRYFLSFAQNQFRLNQMVYKYERLAHIFRECQRDSLNAAWSVEELYVKNIKNDQFCKVLESRLKPIYELARTQGYRIWMVGE